MIFHAQNMDIVRGTLTVRRVGYAIEGALELAAFHNGEGASTAGG
jgi:hypothetical protein